MSINCSVAPVNADDNNLVGTIPSQIGILTKLRVFEVDHNGLTGTIPTELGNLINIVELDLDDNKLTGTIPTEFGTMITARELDLGKSEDYTLEGFYLLLKSNLPCFGNLSHTSFPPGLLHDSAQPALRAHSY